ncbi:hypothetical protein [Atopococcus tabaci]|uniref:hypothetical protein n=1 Tax=Atopococcus tabaci TaxID=269774 RepID=UPI0003FEFAA2|nr:hypothetical protein [Atopococcus tabaci]
MYTIESLLAKYQDNLIKVDEKKDYLDVLKDLVDIEEVDLHILHPVQLKIIEENIENSADCSKNPIKLHFYRVIRNDKSGLYYKELEDAQSLSYMPYFKEPTVFVIHEEFRGLQETNSEWLHRDYIMLRGVTQKDIQEKNRHLFNYLSYLSAWDEADTRN